MRAGVRLGKHPHLRPQNMQLALRFPEPAGEIPQRIVQIKTMIDADGHRLPGGGQYCRHFRGMTHIMGAQTERTVQIRVHTVNGTADRPGVL